MEDLPAPLRQYLSTTDSIVRAQIVAEHGDLLQMLSTPETRSAVLKWLASEAAWEPSAYTLLINALGILRGGSAEEAQVVRPFLLHSEPFVRMAAFEFMLALYGPDQNPEALLMVLQNMLSDQSDKVRSLATHYIENLKLTDDLKKFLDRWYQSAPDKGWDTRESFERIGRILGK
jgi:hypothetical protein